MQFSLHKLDVNNLDVYNDLKFLRSTKLQDGVYNIERITIQVNAEDLLEIQRLLQNGNIWIATSKTELAGVGIEEKEIKQIIKQKRTTNGQVINKDVTHKKHVRELKPEELEALSAFIDYSIEILNKPSSKNPSLESSLPHQSPLQKSSTNRADLEKSKIDGQKKPPKDKKAAKQAFHKAQKSVQQRGIQKEREIIEETKELDENAGFRREVQDEWDIRQDQMKHSEKVAKIKRK